MKCQDPVGIPALAEQPTTIFEGSRQRRDAGCLGATLHRNLRSVVHWSVSQPPELTLPVSSIRGFGNTHVGHSSRRNTPFGLE